ncbi:MAG TPA: NAD-dependent epimerase/dehydratase family protein [Alphaproteobacteria bacterium]|nr:NAD-dependent epimerase/dehydratase family protein [Alphaproteobacteria bacterium]
MALYLVTGGAGFIGSHLADALLKRGDRVRVLDNLSTGKRENLDPRATLTVGDVADAAAVAKAMEGVDGCFHLAAVASVELGNRDWLGTHRANLTGAITIFDAARRAQPDRTVPVVYASSAAVYGDNPDLPLAETAQTRPMSAYGADKLGCELHGRVAAHVHGVRTAGCRFFNVYGPRQDPGSPYSGVISIFFNRIGRGQGITIFGDGGQTRDFIYVADVVDALLRAMGHESRGQETPAAAVFNVCTGKTTSLLELAAAIGRVFGRTPEIAFGEPRLGDIRESLGNPAAAQAALGFSAKFGIEEGLGLMAAYEAK